MVRWKRVSNHVNLLGEGPVWDVIGERIFWVDIIKGQIHYYRSTQNTFKSVDTGKMVGSIALRKQGGLVAALQNGFAFVNLKNETLQLIADVEGHLPENRFNDGKCDPCGRFWAGTMSVKNETAAGSLYVMQPDLSISKKLSHITCSNGLAWNADGSLFYHIDSGFQHIVSYDFHGATGAIKFKNICITIPSENGKPDGMTIDEEGMLWIAIWDGWRVERWNPRNGKLLTTINLPTSKITSCTFGGPKLNDLYVTTASVGMTAEELVAQPLAGSVFIIENCGFRGIAPYEFWG